MVHEPELHPFLTLALERARAHHAVEIALPRDDGLALDVVPRQGSPFRLELHGLHLETLEAGPAARVAALDHRLTLACRPAELPASWSVAAPRLRGVLRSGSLLLDGTELVARPAGPCLVEAIVLDGPDSYTFVTRTDLQAWGVPAPAAFALARSNLAGPDRSVPWDPTSSVSIWSFDPGDGHATSRLLVPGWLEGFVGRVQGRPIAAVPHASLLLVTGDAHPETLARVARTAAREYASSSMPITPVLLRAERNGLEAVRVEPDHPAFDVLEEARVRAWAMDVAAQAEVWDEPVEAVGVRQADGRLASGARARSEASRLPEAEVYLEVTAPTGPPVEGSWPPWRLRD